MILEKISIHNFMSIRDITLPLENQGLTLINGVNLDNPALNNNGAGKSSILEAIVYALYGRTLRGLKGDAIVNRNTMKNMKVSLTIRDDDGTVYTIERHRKHSKLRNKSVLYIDGINRSPALESDFDKAVQQLIQADFTTFTSSLLYSSHSFKFAMATDAEIKRTFDTMLQLDTLTKALEITNSRIHKLQSEIEDQEHFINRAKERIEEIDERLQLQITARDEYDSQYQIKLEHTSQSILALQAKEVALKGELQGLQTELDNRSEKVSETDKRIIKLNTTIRTINKVKDEIQNVKHAISDEQYYIKGCTQMITSNRSAIASLEGTIASKEKRIEEYRSKISDLVAQVGQPCPTCGAALTEESLLPAQQEYSAKINELNKSIESTKEQIEDLYNKNTQANKDIETHTSKINELREEMTEYYEAIDKFKYIEDNLSQAEADRRYLQEQVYETKAAISVKSNEITQNGVLIKQMEGYLRELKNSVNPYTKIVSDLETEKSATQVNLTSMELKLPELNEQLERLQFWTRAFSNQGIKSFILDDITPFLNRRANYYLSKLSSGQLEIIFSTQTTLKGGGQRERFSLKVTNKNGGSEYVANSGGERKRIDLAINLALQDLIASRGNKKINIAIFDEVFDALDENGVDGVISLLRELSKTKSTIMVVSHNEYFKSFFTNCITVIKKDGFSYLKV